MTLAELIARHAWRPDQGVPDWMLGWYKRYSISFAHGLTDVDTHVCWLQSRNFTIDLRLPRRAQQPSPEQGQALAAGRWADIHPASWAAWADFEGWKAPATWDGRQLRWHTPDACLQWHDRWPEPATLHRVGTCMVEFCDSGAYVEDWRLQPSAPGPLVGLHLLCELDARTQVVRHTGGGWIVCGDHAALVRGRAPTAPVPGMAAMLREHVATLCAQGPQAWPQLAALFDFEASVATVEGGAHRVVWSNQPQRVGEVLCPTDGLSWLGLAQTPALPLAVPPHLAALPRVSQTLQVDGVPVVRHFAVDTIEPAHTWAAQTACTPQASAWLAKEHPTLSRYAAVLHDAHPDPRPV